MVPWHIRLFAVFISILLILSGVSIGTGGQRPRPARIGQQINRGACAQTPPAAHTDPPADVIGWENGIWYNRSLTVSQRDGLTTAERKVFIARTMARVEFVRCIEFPRSVPVSTINRTTFRQRLAQRTVSLARRWFTNTKFEALFLVNESVDATARQNGSGPAIISGFYAPRLDQIVLVTDKQHGLRLDEITLAHELVHAYQDFVYNLSIHPFAVRVRDEINARNALVEGDARYTEILYRRRCQRGTWHGTCLTPESGRAGGDGGGDRDSGDGGGGNFGRFYLTFQPRSDGAVFVRHVRIVGGWDAVNALYNRPPTSTEQVIHNQKYHVDAPAEIQLRDQTTAGWQRVRPPARPDFGSLGEAAVMAMFVYPFYHSTGRTRVLPPPAWLNFNKTGSLSRFDPYDYRSRYSAGWDGDRLHVYRNATNATAYVWRLAWDSPQDARQFMAGYRRVLRYWGAIPVGPSTYVIPRGGFADAFHVRRNGTTVTIVNAPTVTQLDAVRVNIGTGPMNTTATMVTAFRSENPPDER